MSPLRYCPAALLLVSGCILSPGDCTYQLRSLELTGTMTGSALRPGSPPAVMSITLAESKDGVSYRILSGYITTPAAPAISLVQLRQLTPQGPAVLLTFPMGDGQRGTWAANVDLAGDSLPFRVLSLLAHSGKLGVYAQAGIQGNLGELAGNLKVRSETGWEHPRCD